MLSLKTFRAIPFVMLLLVASSKGAEAENAFFESKVRPLLAERCYQCHSKKAVEDGKLKGGL